MQGARGEEKVGKAIDRSDDVLILPARMLAGHLRRRRTVLSDPEISDIYARLAAALAYCAIGRGAQAARQFCARRAASTTGSERLDYGLVNARAVAIFGHGHVVETLDEVGDVGVLVEGVAHHEKASNDLGYLEVFG